MPVISPPPVDSLPEAPSTSAPSTFAKMGDLLLSALAPFRSQLVALANNVFGNATEAQSRALQAQQSAADANSSAIAAAASSNAVKWVSGTAYSDGFAVWSPLTRWTYRRIGAGAGTTDPSIDAANWAIQLLALGMGGITLTGNVALTSLSPAAMAVTPSGPGFYMILDDATTYLKAGFLISVANLGEYDYGIKNKVGTVLGWVRAKSNATLGLVDNSTVAGTWIVSGAQKTGVTAEFTTAAIPSSGGYLQRLTIDANRSFLMFGSPSTGASEVYGVVFDSSLVSPWGSPVLIRAGANEAVAVLSGASQIMVVSVTGTAFEAVTLTIAGIGLTVNSGTKRTSTLAAASSGLTQLLAVAGGWAFGYIASSVTSTYVQMLTVSGTTPALGGAVVLSAAAAERPMLFVTGLILRVVYADSATLFCKPFTIAGFTLTPGTASSTTVNGAVSATYRRAVMNSNGNIVCQYVQGGERVAVFKLTGTTEAATTAQVSSLNVPATVQGDMAVISGGGCVVAYADGSGNLQINVAVDSAGTVSAPTTTGLQISGMGLLNVAVAAVSGSVVRFLASGANCACQITIDFGSGAPVLQSCQALDATVGVSPISDSSGLTSYRRLLAGSSVYTIGSVTAFDGLFTPTGAFPIGSKHQVFAGGAPGAAANEAWATSLLGSTGTTIKRIEAAA